MNIARVRVGRTLLSDAFDLLSPRAAPTQYAETQIQKHRTRVSDPRRHMG
jgi:hypothetical protein